MAKRGRRVAGDTARVPSCLLEANADRWLSGQKQQTVNLPAHAVYGGSNPPLSTGFETRNWKFETQGNLVCGRGTWMTSFDFRVSSFQVGGGSNSVVESQPSKLLVAGSIPVSRSKKQWRVTSG